MELSKKIAALYVATLKAISLIHQNSHWSVKGSNFYGDHLLFERLYDNTLEDLDASAEKFIGLFGSEYLSYDLQTELLSKVLGKYSKLEGSPVQMSLQVELDFLKFSQEAYQSFEKEDTLTLGLDDFLMATADKHEENVYLLKQSLEE